MPLVPVQIWSNHLKTCSNTWESGRPGYTTVLQRPFPHTDLSFGCNSSSSSNPPSLHYINLLQIILIYYVSFYIQNNIYPVLYFHFIGTKMKKESQKRKKWGRKKSILLDILTKWSTLTFSIKTSAKCWADGKCWASDRCCRPFF